MLRWLSCVAVLVFALPAFAATPVFVDGAGMCAGRTPCFTTIQAGVNNAGPAPAIVNVFPGDYESVDLGLMGSAIGGSTGDLTLRTVDADGDPLFGTARILPASGDTIFNNAPFIGDIVINGFTVTSPNGDAIQLLQIQGTVELRGVTSDENAGSGLIATIIAGDLEINASSFDRNETGAIVEVAGNVRIDQSSFDRNQRALVLSAESDLDINASSFDGNRNGATIAADGNVRIDRSSFDDNQGGEGLLLSAGRALILASSFERNGAAGVRLSGNSLESQLRCNDIAGNADGLVVDSNITVVAETNFWGSPSGPTHPSNPGGTGDTVRDGASGGSGTVDFTPFLTVPAAESDQCVSHAAPALDRTALATLSLALVTLATRRLMRAPTTRRA